MPIMHVYTQAPDATEAAIRLANASVAGPARLSGRLNTSETVSLNDEIQLIQLGAVRGGVVNHSAAKEIALLAFITGFAATLFGVRLAAALPFRLAVGRREPADAAVTPTGTIERSAGRRACRTGPGTCRATSIGVPRCRTGPSPAPTTGRGRGGPSRG